MDMFQLDIYLARWIIVDTHTRESENAALLPWIFGMDCLCLPNRDVLSKKMLDTDITTVALGESQHSHIFDFRGNK